MAVHAATQKNSLRPLLADSTKLAFTARKKIYQNIFFFVMPSKKCLNQKTNASPFRDDSEIAGKKSAKSKDNSSVKIKQSVDHRKLQGIPDTISYALTEMKSGNSAVAVAQSGISFVAVADVASEQHGF